MFYTDDVIGWKMNNRLFFKRHKGIQPFVCMPPPPIFVDRNSSIIDRESGGFIVEEKLFVCLRVFRAKLGIATMGIAHRFR